VKTEGFVTTVGYVRRHFPDFEIVNAHKGMAVQLEPEDLKLSKRKDPMQCVFACAVKRQEETIGPVIVCRSTAMIVYPERKLAVRYLLPERERKIVVRFDLTGQAPMGSFYFGSARKAETPRKRSAASRGNGAKKGSRQTPAHTIAGVRNWIAPTDSGRSK